MIWGLIGLLAIILSCLQELAVLAGVLVLGVIGLVIIVCFAKGIKWLWDESTKTLQLASDGLKKKYNIRKLSATLKHDSKAIDTAILRLKQLRAQKIDSESVQRFGGLVELLANCSNSVYVDQCYSVIDDKRKVLVETSTIEKKILSLAEKYQAIGNAEKCAHYLGFLAKEKSCVQLSTIQDKCNSEAALRKKENEAIGRVCWTLITFAIAIVLICIVCYNANTPYRELETAMRSETLTREQCTYSSKGEEGSVYEYIKTDKGKKLIAKILTEYHKNNDIESALWLICIQPGYIDGYDIAATKAFIDWISECARNNGKLVEDGIETYVLHGYSIAIYDYSDTYLRIFDGDQWAEVEQKVSYQNDAIPTIY